MWLLIVKLEHYSKQPWNYFWNICKQFDTVATFYWWLLQLYHSDSLYDPFHGYFCSQPSLEALGSSTFSPHLKCLTPYSYKMTSAVSHLPPSAPAHKTKLVTAFLSPGCDVFRWYDWKSPPLWKFSSLNWNWADLCNPKLLGNSLTLHCLFFGGFENSCFKLELCSLAQVC